MQVHSKVDRLGYPAGSPNMRLINCTTLELEEYFGSNIPPYAILSHTWGDEEVTFGDLPLSQPSTQARVGYRKIKYTCQQARRHGLEYAWVDTCCIDKSSSAELSEAINSMFTWYKDSVRCYAYLADVSESDKEDSFPKSRWFTRGWTLQELLAPRDVIFYDRLWNRLLTRSDNARYISEITKIDPEVMTLRELAPYGKADFASFCVAKRMSWASRRETTRTEDIAYCLLGLFDVNMPLLYGEGERAFLRLQQEIIRKVNDDSILAWGLNSEVYDFEVGTLQRLPIALPTPTLARSPKDFEGCTRLEYGLEQVSSFTITNIGVQIQLPLVPVFGQDEAWIGLLSCSTGSPQEFLAIPLYRGTLDDWSRRRVVRVPSWKGSASCKTIVVGLRTALRSSIETITIMDFIHRRQFLQAHTAHILLNISQALVDKRYRVKSMKGLDFSRQRDQVVDLTWNTAKWILQAKYAYGGREFELFEFQFDTWLGGERSTFTVFMHISSCKAIAREGNIFSEDEKRSFEAYIKDESIQDDMKSATIADKYGNMYQITVGVHLKKVYDRQLFELNIDAVLVATGH